ncbi:MAG TPA: hypothetical protein VFX19_07735 [Dehalococcoidia bacterium]|jgi:hypothetical protein|nr:hypothetical protein [Dehalococcoidia bacterium]
MKNVFVPGALAEVEKALAVLDLAAFGIELIPIPADGGCIVVIREKAAATGSRWRRCLQAIGRQRARLQAVAALESFALQQSMNSAHNI